MCDSRQAARRWVSHSIQNEKDARASGDLSAAMHTVISHIAPVRDSAQTSHVLEAS